VRCNGAIGRYREDCVAKLKNEMTAEFRRVPVEMNFPRSDALQRAHEGSTLKIGLIM
jgi:hypothetical protein